MAKKFTIPVKLESLANKREHWAKKAMRAQQQRFSAFLLCPMFDVPCVITITRIAPRQLDTDNLAISAKHVRDGIADRVKIDDRDPRILWRYEQRKGKPREYLAEVSIHEND